MKILIIKPSSLGDVIHAMPVISDLKEINPSNEIHWLVNDTFKDLVESVNGIDKVFTFNRKSWTQTSKLFGNIHDIMKLSKALKKQNYDLAIDLQGLFRSAFFGFISNAKQKAGFADSREFSNIFYNKKISTGTAPIHAVDKNRKVIEQLFPDYTLKPASFPIKLTDSVALSTDQLLKDSKVTGKFCILCPEARWLSKKWPEEYFLKLSELISENLGIQVLITGDLSSRKKWENLTVKMQPNVISVAGKTSLLELSELFKRCEFAVTNDSGPMHLCVAMNKKVYALIGPTAPQKTGPYRNAKVIKSELDCCPCFKKTCPKDKDTPLCMAGILPGKVLQNIL